MNPLEVSKLDAKFETFPVWNMPFDHPVNVAYEAATLDLDDCNLIDYFHEQAYHITSVNYNRDIEAFPRGIFEKITKSECIYKSPTDKGIKCISSGIISDEAIRTASKQEIMMTAGIFGVLPILLRASTPTLLF